MKRLILIDAHAIIHRAYHTLPPLTSSSGDPVNAVYGFTTILLRILRELKPDYIAAAFDLPGPTFRHVAYERYKAHRPETPSDLSSQFNKVKEMLDAFGIVIFEKKGFEADDVIGTIAEKFKKDNKIQVIIVTGDMDTLQLIRPGLEVYAMKKGISETIIYSAKEVKERYGITPGQMIDFKGLKGDPSDNIPGVKGIGEKTATMLIQEFGSIEGIFKALKNKKISASLAEKLKNGEEDAKFSRDLAMIKTDVPLDLELKKMEYREQAGSPQVHNLLQALGFYSLLKRLSGMDATHAKKLVRKEDVQQDMFAGAPALETASWKHVSTESEWHAFITRNRQDDFGFILYFAPTSAQEEFTLREGRKNAELFIISRKGKEAVHILAEVITSQKFGDFLQNKNYAVYDAKSVLHFLQAFGQEPEGIIFDIKLASYLTGEFSRDFSYMSVVSRELGRIVSQDMREEFVHFFEIRDILVKKLAAKGLEKAMYEIDLPLVQILVDMESTGILIDRNFLRELSGDTSEKLSRLTSLIYKEAGEEFNINSSQQMSRILFEKLGVKTHGLRKTAKSGVVSTSASELEKLRDLHPVIRHILEYREFMKLKSTYIDVLPRLADQKTSRVHTTFHQTGTATGRLSSSDPNLQNIPIMSDYGKKIRKAFIAKKGFVLASFDYSQIELRVAAVLARDKKMIDAFIKGIDIHALTASEIYNVPIENVTPDLRRAAKTLNFGILYGMGAQSLAESTSLSREEARKFINEYFHDFAGIRDYIETTKACAEAQGFVETLFGRRRYIPEIYSANWQIKREAERMAINMPIQGTAADVVKLAMISVYNWIKKEKLEKEVALLLQVHDELVLEIKKDLQNAHVYAIKRLMESVIKFPLPLVVDVKAGENWGEMERLK